MPALLWLIARCAAAIASARGRLMSSSRSRTIPINHDTRTPRCASGTSLSDHPSGEEDTISLSDGNRTMSMPLLIAWLNLAAGIVIMQLLQCGWRSRRSLPTHHTRLPNVLLFELPLRLVHFFVERALIPPLAPDISADVPNSDNAEPHSQRYAANPKIKRFNSRLPGRI